MRTSPLRILIVCATFLLGCGSPDPLGPGPGAGGNGGEEAGGDGGSGGSGGANGGSGGGAGSGGAKGGSGGTAGTGGSGGGNTPTLPDAAAPDAVPPAPDATMTTTTPAANAPYGCTGCKPIFDGKTLDGWVTPSKTAWVARDGILASTGAAVDIWTVEDFGDVRIFFKVRQKMGNHKPGTILFGTRPAEGAAPKRGLGGAQFQPPNGASWDYGAGGTFMRLTNPNFNVNNWHQCEVLAKVAGSFRAACCPVMAETPTPCKGVEVLRWKGNGKKFPFSIQMHNGGLFDEYKDIWADTAPVGDDLLSMK